jgi:serpin B
MQQALKTSDLSAAALNAAFKDLNQQFTGRTNVILHLANGLWIQNGFQLKPAFVADHQEFFQAELANVDFQAPSSAQMINDWADRQTRGKITGVVGFPFPPLTRLVLANAIYFKGAWVEPFKPRLTRPRDFHPANGQSKPTPMMTRDGRFTYQETADFQAVKLPYQGGFQMELYLPQTNTTAQKLLAGFMAGEDWEKVIEAGFSKREGSVTLPKFKINYEIKLNDSLQALGMKSAFARNADFSGIADAPLFISQVKQKSYVDVNEEGTEAAAVTTVMMTASLVRRPPPDRFTMVLDRPFLFVISDVNTGSLLFLGLVNEPD